MAISKVKILNAVRNSLDTPEININIKDASRIKIPPNVMVFQTFAYLAATKLNPTSNRILMLFIAVSQYENGVSMDVESIREELGIKSKTTILTALKELEENGVILKIPYLKDKRRNEYYINPIAAWKGNGFSRRDFMRSNDPNQLNLFNVSAQDHVIREEKEMKKKSPLLSEWDKIEKNAIESARGTGFE